MPLAAAVTLAAIRTALTAPGTGRHRCEPWHRRAATTLRFVLGIPQPADRYRGAHARRRYATA